MKKADLRWAHLGEAVLIEAHLEGANLSDAHLEEANLIQAHLDKARLIGTHLEGASLSGSALRGAYFYRTYLDRTRFSKSNLAQKSEMTDEEARHAKPLIGEESESRWFAAKGAYLVIKNNFRSLGQYEDKSWAYVKERQMERKSFFPAEEGDRWLAQREKAREEWYGERITHQAILEPPMILALWLGPSPLWWRLRLFLWRRPRDIGLGWRPNRLGWLRNAVFEGLAGYGEHLWKPLLWGLGIVLLWSLLFALVGVEGVQDGTDYLIFSLRSFATMAFADLWPSNVPAKLLSAVEAMLGVSTLALVMYCLGRRMSGS